MTDDERRALEQLERMGWMASDSPGLAAAVVAEGAVARLPAGRWVQAEGDEDAGLLVVVEGAVDLYCPAPGDRQVRIGHLGAGTGIGQTTRFGGGPRLVTAVCAVPSLVLRVSDAGLARVARDRPEVWRAVASMVYLQLRAAVQMAAEAIALPPRARVAARLAALSRGREPPVALALSQQALGELTGLSRKTVSGLLGEFRRRGLITLDYGRIGVLDPRGLERLADL